MLNSRQQANTPAPQICQGCPDAYGKRSGFGLGAGSLRISVLVFSLASVILFGSCTNAREPTPVQPNSPSHCSTPPSTTSCEYYSCVEEKYHCGPEGYPIRFAQSACKWFGRDCGGRLKSPESQAWTAGVRFCLQDDMERNIGNLANCEQMWQFADESHLRCYVSGAKETGSISYCSLSQTDKDAIYDCLVDREPLTPTTKGELDDFIAALGKACNGK